MTAYAVTPQAQAAHDHNVRHYGFPGFGCKIATPAEERQHRSERQRERKEITAYHEAGHAVVAATLGFHEVWINLIPEDRDLNGVTEYGVPNEWGAENRSQRELAVLYAGALSEKLGFGGLVGGGYMKDKEDAEELLSPEPEKRQKQIDPAQERARKLLKGHWPDVEWIAQLSEVSPLLEVTAERCDGFTGYCVTVLRCEKMPSELMARMGPK